MVFDRSGVGHTFVLEPKKIPVFLVIVAILLFCFLPWFLLVAGSAKQIGGLDSNLDWIPVPDWRSVGNLLADFSGSFGSQWSKITGIVIFNIPIIIWAWQIFLTNENNTYNDESLFWWLSLVTFTPIVIIFIASQYFRQALWIDRYFIFLVVPYLLLVSSALSRLKCNWLRYGLITLIIGWSVTTMVYELHTYRLAWTNPQVGSRIVWNNLAREISGIENSQEEVPIFTLSTLSEKNMTGDWAIKTSLEYHFAEIGEERFDVIYAGNYGNLLEQVKDEEHFWVGYFDLGTIRHSESLEKLLSDNGFIVGSAVKETRYVNQLVILPVWSIKTEKR